MRGGAADRSLPVRAVGALAPLAAIILLAVCLAPTALAAEDMSVKMQWTEQLHPDEVSRVSLEIKNINDGSRMNVSSCGIHFDWLALGVFETNATPFVLAVGDSHVVEIIFRVPIDAKAGKHSDYIRIYYALENATTGKWDEQPPWESEITKDFNIAAEGGGSPWAAFFGGNLLCFGAFIVVVIVVIGATARRLRRRWRKRNKYEEPEEPVAPAGTTAEAAQPQPEAPAAAPSAAAGRPPGDGPANCPFCGAPNPGRHCNSCGWDMI